MKFETRNMAGPSVDSVAAGTPVSEWQRHGEQVNQDWRIEKVSTHT